MTKTARAQNASVRETAIRRGGCGHIRKAAHNSSPSVARPPSKCAVTMIGLSLSVTVHIPSMAWKMIRPRVASRRREELGARQVNAPANGTNTASAAQTSAAPIKPLLIETMATIAINAETITAVRGNRESRAALKASASTSRPRLPAKKR